MSAKSDAFAQAPSLLVCVGDMSADRHTAEVLTRLKHLAPQIHIWGVGGPAMEACGVKLIANCQRFATIGIIEPLKLLPFFAGLRASLLLEIEKRKPGAVLLVDFGGFNIGLAQLIRPRYPHLPILYFISPQIWGSRPWRINVLKRLINKMLTIFPFEEAIYKKAGVPARFVGHPLAEKIKPADDKALRADFAARHKLDPAEPIVGIFPGSRTREITELMPVVLQAVDQLCRKRKQIQFVVSKAGEATGQSLEQLLNSRRYKHLLQQKFTILPAGENLNLMACADILWTKSGTTTLEATLYHKPMLIFYRGNWLSYWLFLLFKQVKHIGWPNLLAGRLIVPELIQLDCRAEKLVKYTGDWLDVPGCRGRISNCLKQATGLIRQGDFAGNVAAEILSALGMEAGDIGKQQAG